MATKKKPIKKGEAPDYMDMAMQAGLALAGGVAANYASNFLEKQEFMEGYKQYTPFIPTAIGLAGFLLIKEPAVKAFALGMMVVSGTEAVEENLLKDSSMPSTTNGAAGVPRAMGFTPQLMPAEYQQYVVRTKEGVVIR